MRKSAFVLLFLVLLLAFIRSLPQKVIAGNLGATVRLDRQKINVTTGGLICTTPESIGTENTLQVIFPTGMTVNTSASNWTVGTSNIPDDATPMPGITTATTVSGKTVTFPISDLTVSTKYCFTFAASNTITTPSSTGSYTGTIRTRNSSNATIDTIDFQIPIVSNDGIVVTAAVAAQPTDFSASLELTDPEDGFMRENTTLSYKIEYGSTLSTPSNIIVVAEWEQGTIEGNSTATEDVVSYVIGSASDAYNNTEPIIDTINRTISWEIASFPANTTRDVTFKLKTYDDYIGSLPVTFRVNGRVLGPGTQTADATVISKYKLSSFITPTPRPTCIPSKCPTPTPSLTPTPTPVPDATVISNIEVRTINSNGASIFISSNNATSARVSYGTSKNSLNESLTQLTLTKSHLITFEDLEPQTRYYFRIRLTDEYKRVLTSDLYVFDTAALSTPPQAQLNSIIITSNDVVLTDPLRDTTRVPRIILPYNTPYSFKFAVSGYENVKAVKAFTRNDNVLGISVPTSYASTQNLTITEISPGQYIGKISPLSTKGVNNLVLQISDYSGNIIEQTAAVFEIVQPLIVVNGATQEPVENAKITLYFYNERLKTYELLSSAVTPIKNPNYTDPSGTSSVVLPEGKYRAEIEALGYKSKTVDFEINSRSGKSYPEVILQPLPFSASTYLQYTLSTAADAASLLRNYVHALRSSIRFFDLIAFCTVCLLVFLCIVATGRRFSIPLNQLPFFAFYEVTRFFRKPSTVFVHGKVIALGTENVIQGATIYVEDQNGKVLSHTGTNSDGDFFVSMKMQQNIKLSIRKKGFELVDLNIKEQALDKKHVIELSLLKKPKGFSFQNVYWYISYITGVIFEALLFFTLLVELVFVLEFGWLRVLPFIIVSLLNIAIWAFHVKHTRSI